MEHLEDQNSLRTRRHGRRIGDIIEFIPFDAHEPCTSEVIGYYPIDDNRLYVKSKEGTVIEIYAECCTIKTRVEERRDGFSLAILEKEIVSAFEALIQSPDWLMKTGHSDKQTLGNAAVQQFNDNELSIGGMYFGLEICKTKIW